MAELSMIFTVWAEFYKEEQTHTVVSMCQALF